MPSKSHFEESIRELCLKFIEHEEYYEVIINDEVKFRNFVKIFKQYGMDFAVRNSSEKRKNPDRRLLWQYKTIKTFNTPFYIKNVIVKECVLGAVRRKKEKKLYLESVNPNHENDKQKRFRSQPTKKMGCQGTMKIVEIVCFPQYSLPENSLKTRKEKSKKLKNLCTQLEQHEGTVLTEQRYYITVSKESVHIHSASLSFMNQTLHEELKQEIYKHVMKGLTDVGTIQVLLKDYVENNVSREIPASSRSFYPTRKTIYNHILKCMHQSKASKIDQVIVEESIEEIYIPCTDSEISFEQIESPASVEEASCVPPTETSNSRENWVEIRKIRELAKCIYDSSLLITSCSNVDFYFLREKLLVAQKAINQFIISEHNTNITSKLPNKKNNKAEIA